MTINIYTAWICFLAGCLAGATPGLFFYDERWLGGYLSWRRRMIRLAHISFFGIGLLNLAFALTARALAMQSGLALPSALLITGAVAMPLVCYLSAWRPLFRHVFFIPALCVTGGVALFLWRMIAP